MSSETIILPIHILVLLYTLGNVAMADHEGLAWVRGKAMTLDAIKLARYHKRIWIGLGLMILTGTLLFVPLREYLLRRPSFYIKMACIGALIANGTLIGDLMKIATEKSFKEVSIAAKVRLFVSGAISSLAWLGAIIAAMFLEEE